MGDFVVVIPPMKSKMYNILDVFDVIDASNAVSNANIILDRARWELERIVNARF